MKTLKNLYALHAPSGEEGAVKRYVRRWIGNKVPECEVWEDAKGNVYARKGDADGYPTIVAHLDQVQRFHPDDMSIVDTGDSLIGWSPTHMCSVGLGADDKNGVWIALKMLEKHPVAKAAFFVEEEIGCGGSDEADMDFFADSLYVLQADRKGNSDLITSIYGEPICSPEFANACLPWLYGYREAEGMLTDVRTLVERGVGVSCVNISCGYYSPHTDVEATNKADLLNCLAFVDHVFSTVKDRMPFTPEPRTSYGYGHGYGRGYDYGYDYGDYYGCYGYGGSRGWTAPEFRAKAEPEEKEPINEEEVAVLIDEMPDNTSLHDAAKFVQEWYGCDYIDAYNAVKEYFD